MIRLIYWLAILVEFLLLLVVLFIFIVTDARTIKIVAQKGLATSKFEYQSIEGNFFTGLKVSGLSYNKKLLFDSATLHWNPLNLLHKEITLQEVEARGVEVENVLDMVKDFNYKDNNSSLNFDFSIVLSNIHLDINPYIYEGVKFSSFLFETKKLELSKKFLIDSKNIYLQFDSDLVNVELEGSMVKNGLFVDTLSLKEIDSKAITKFVKRLKRKIKRVNKTTGVKKSKTSEPFLKKIKIKRIIATLKDVNYNPLSIYKTKVLISHGVIDPYNHYSYSVKRVKLIGYTNFGQLNYKGYIKNSTIYANGNIVLFKDLFNRYHLPLNYQTLKKIPSKLKLNHYGVWVDIDHKSENLLKIKSDFNLDVLQSHHKLHYDYSDNRFTVDSELKGKMPYADIFNIENKVIIDKEKGFRYIGKVDIPKIKALPTDIIQNLTGEFKGTSKKFNIELDSRFIDGSLMIDKYKSAVLKLDSKRNGIKLIKLIPSLSSIPYILKNEKISFSTETFLDFKNFKKSNLQLNLYSNILNLSSTTELTKPFSSHYNLDIPSNSLLKTLDPKINFTKFRHLEGDLDIFSNRVNIKAKNRNLTFDIEYDRFNQTVKRGFLSLEGQKFRLFSLGNGNLGFKSNISEIQSLFKKIKKYYKINFPRIKGSLNLDIVHMSNGTFTLVLKSPHLEYILGSKDDKVIKNFYDIDIDLTVDKNKKIKIRRYAFKIDDNEYESRFYSNRESYLTLKSDKIEIERLWVNDKILINGSYNFFTSVGNLFLNTESFEFKNRDFDFIVDFRLNLQVSKDNISLLGDIDMFGNSITYEVIGSDIVEDADIVIVKDNSNKKESISNNLTLDLKIISKKPLKYISRDTNIEFFNDLRVIKKPDANIIVSGMSTITKGYYEVEDKKFILDKSHIYFAGDPKKPLLDIKAEYKKDEYIISIFISGSTEEPIVNFSSEPYLTQQEILSLILFDGTGSSNGGGAEAYTLLGGTFAKGLIKSLGIDVDHLRLGTDTNDNFSFEIGRKISKDVTVMYQHEDGKDGVKVRVEHNKNFETDIIIQPPNSSSIEFLYKYSE